MAGGGGRVRRSSAAALAVVLVAAAVIAVFAWDYRGYPDAGVQLDDAGVWVTDQRAGLVGRVNHAIDELDASVRSPAQDFDVLQDGDTVVIDAVSESSLYPVDTAAMRTGEKVALSSGSTVAMAGGRIAVLDDATGSLRVGDADALAEVGQGAEPVAEAGPGGDVTVTGDGTVFALSAAEDTVITVARDGTVHEDALGTDAGARAVVTAVGDTPVVLDPDSRTVAGRGWSRTVDGAGGLALQQPGPAADAVLVATEDALVAFPLGGGEPSAVATAPSTGAPAAPVVTDDCSYGAWSSPDPAYLRECDGQVQDLSDAIGPGPAGRTLRLRSNRQAVVLEDSADGDVYTASENVRVVDNWEDVIPPDDPDAQDDPDAVRTRDEAEQQQRSGENRPPMVLDDDFGVRAGRTSTLPVLDNDSDPDGDVLTAEPVGDAPPGIGVARTDGGLALQVDVPADVAGGFTLRYRASDGRGGTGEADVRVEVHPDDVNAPPVAKAPSPIRVAQGESVDYNALAAWTDPDGDALYAVAAQAQDPSDEVRILPDGRLTFADGGKALGGTSVTVTVSDGRAESRAQIPVTVLSPADAAPTANPDHVLVRAGRAATVAPLSNDTDPTGGGLRLTKAADVPGLAVEPDFGQGLLQVTAEKPGSYYLDYMVANGPGSSTGTIRVDAMDPGADGAAPTAGDDVALLPTGGQTVTDVLANDFDPGGGVLVVTGISVPATAPVAVGVVDGRVLRISDSSGLQSPLAVGYTVSNGTASASGTVDVVPLAPAGGQSPPAAEPDEATVRAGDIVTVDVLRNDSHPDGDTMHLVPTLVQDADAAAGTTVIAGDQLRFHAGDQPTTAYMIYEVADSHGQSASAQVTIHVTPADPEQNSPPAPRAITAHAISGRTTTIVAPLDGIDPDGDSVTLSGVAEPPSKGRIGRVAGATIEYTPVDGETGVDRFTYLVRDRLGAEATAQVTVGIAPVSQTNQPPGAIKDAVWVRPDRAVSVPVLANDTDPDSDPLTLEPDGLDMPGSWDASVEGRTVLVHAPHETGVASGRYTVRDERGAAATGVVTVRVDPDAPLWAPVGHDDVVTAAEAADRSRVDVDVLANDEDPDGRVSQLRLDVDAPDARVSPDGTVSVELHDDPRIIGYRLTDSDGLTGGAFIRVPGRTQAAPALTDDSPVTVAHGEQARIDITERVSTRPGTTPRLTGESSVRAPHSDGSPPVSSPTELVFTPAADFFGDTAITFEVTDGDGPDDPDGNTAVLSVPITVTPSENQPPRISDADVRIAPGDDTVVDLAALASDPDPGDEGGLSFTVDGRLPGISAAVQGGALTLTADAAAAVGEAGALPVRVDDGSGHTADGVVRVTVVRTDRPPVVANTDIVADAQRGRQARVDVLANDVNPFPDTPLTLLSAQVVSGAGTADVEGDAVTVTPSASGTMTVRYRIVDATRDPDREAIGSIQVTVRDAPEAPGTPRVDSVRNGTVVLTWSAPSDNGAPITGYTVEGNGVSKECRTTTCTVDGLRNGTEYAFTVRAENEVGVSDPSPASAPATPDATPDVPAPPTLTAGDQKIDVSWQAPHNEGTPIRSYTLEVSPAGPGGGHVQVTGTSTTLTGLQNGVSYRVRVQASNDAPDPSGFSAFSAAATPAGLPATPAAPTAQRAQSAVNGGVVDLSWQAPDPNGADVTAYDVVIFEGGAQVDSRDGLPATTTRLSLTGLDQKGEYAFAVVAHNRVGASAQGRMSATVTPYGLPGTVTGVTAAFRDGAATVSYAAADGNGSPITEYRVDSAQGPSATCTGTSCDVGGLTNGTDYAFTVTAVNAAGPGQPSAPSPVGSPFGAPKAPSVSGRAAGKQTTFTWNSDTKAMENGRPVTVTVTFDATTVPNSGTATLGDGYGQNHTLTIKVCAAEGGCDTSTAQATSAAPPQKKVTLSMGPSGTYQAGGKTYSGHHYTISVRNFAAGSTVTCKEVADAAASTDGERHVFTTTVRTDGDGNGSATSTMVSRQSVAQDVDGFSCGGVQAVTG